LSEVQQPLIGWLRQAILAPSLGGVDTLMMRPAVVSHRNLSREERERIGIGATAWLASRSAWKRQRI
jgi:cystathionine beta-lyase/cystathionine gamma-synthase